MGWNICSNRPAKNSPLLIWLWTALNRVSSTAERENSIPSTSRHWRATIKSCVPIPQHIPLRWIPRGVHGPQFPYKTHAPWVWIWKKWFQLHPEFVVADSFLNVRLTIEENKWRLFRCGTSVRTRIRRMKKISNVNRLKLILNYTLIDSRAKSNL